MTTETPERQAALAALRRFQRRYSRAVDSLKALEAERETVYRDARLAGVTFRVIADVFGITEAAVMQKLNRRDRVTNGSKER